MVYITRSRRPSASSVRFGGATAATPLSAGLNQMSEGLPRRSTPASGRRRIRGCLGGSLLIHTRLAGVLLVKHSLRPTVLPYAPPRTPLRPHAHRRSRASVDRLSDFVEREVRGARTGLARLAARRAVRDDRGLLPAADAQLRR